VVTIVIESAYIQNLPGRLTGSKDVIIFAEVWENAAAGFSSTSTLTNIVYIGPNQKVPGRLNLRDMLAYGPTKYKGHPLRIKFTMMVLQKQAADRQASAIDIINSFVAAAGPQYGVASSNVARLLQGILRAQPDIKFFDFDVTLFSDRPEGHLAVIESPKPAGVTTQARLRGALKLPDGADEIHWLRYGRYALVETVPYDREDPILNLQSDVLGEDARLWTNRTTPLAASHIVFRVLPGQKSETNEVLRAASDASIQMIDSLKRSEADMKAALQDIQTAATNLQDEVLRSRADSLAYKMFREAQVKKEIKTEADCAAIGKRFDERWKTETARVTDDMKRQADIIKIGDGVRAHWVDKCEGSIPAATTTTPAAGAPKP
jgi:hypothetical protein